MFWGLIMEPGRRYSQKVKKSFRVTMAAIDVLTSEKEPCQVMCGYEGRNYLLCTLRKPDLLQCSLDLEFASNSEVSFASNGNSHIHLTGYLIDVDEDGSLADLEEQEEEELAEEEVYFKEKSERKKRKKENAEAPPSKKARLLNGSVEEEESDDPDFEEVEAESGEEEASDEEIEEEGEEEEDGNNSEDSEEIEEEEAQEQKEVKKKSNKKQQGLAKINGDQKNDEKAQLKKQKRKVLAKGVIIEDLVEGSGQEAKSGRYLNVYYEGRLEKTNKVFDSMSKGPGFKFRLGAGNVIKAWDIGLTGMKVGGKRKIICPPNTAYGAKGSPPAIPPSSTLVFTVELKKVN